MKLHLLRTIMTDHATVGVLRVDGRHECFICEDTYRPPPEPKVPKFTAIPCGTYPVTITHSPRFGVDMPLLLDVPGFQGVRIHPGNAPEDTEGCLLPGRTAAHNYVGESRLAYEALLLKLRGATGRGESITITIEVA